MKDLKYFNVIPHCVLYSLLMDLVTILAIILELRGTEAKWNKFERTGGISGRPMSRNRKKE